MLNRTLTLLLTALVVAPLANAADKVPLKLELPRPLFAGTPRPIQLPNLEPARAGKRPDFMVPAGTSLLSKGKKVTSSDSLPVIGELTFVTDGDKTGTDGTYVELGPNPQWVQVDLGSSAKVAAVVVWHFHSQARVYHDVVVQISDDAEFKKGVKTVYNNDDDNSSKLGKGSDKAYIEDYQGRIIDGKGATGRYVRLNSNGNTSDELNHYCEVEVFGTPAK
ncbi:MAG: discoidin domain-containing protein [Opitutaceae bacterium]|nr:discoidin domain-containing protein [Opitutaceae bacterium]